MAIFTAIVAALGFTGFFATAATFALEIGASIGISYAAKALAGNPTSNTQSSDNTTSGMQGAIQAAGDVPRSFPLGACATAGSLVYANTWGTISPGGTDTPNAFLTQVIALSDLPGCQMGSFLWVDGSRVTYDPAHQPVDSHGGYELGVRIPQYYDGSAWLWVKFYDGTQTVADPLLVNLVSSSDRPYESTRVGKGVAYAIVTSATNDKLFTGFPTYLFEVAGIPLYDPTLDSTNGGSGTHRYSDPTTWGGDGDNYPAVQLYNLLRGFRYNGTWLYGLQNMTTARLPAVNWNTQINKCRTTITGISGAEPTYRSGGQVSVDQQAVNIAQSLLTTCQGRLSEIGGFYKAHIGSPDSSSFSFTDDDILSTQQQRFAPFFGLADSVNGITATYPEPAQGWAMTPAPALYSSANEAIDGGRRLLANPTFDFVPYTAQAQRLMKSALLEARRERQHTIVLWPAFWIVEPGDVGSWTSTRNGYSSKLFRVDGIADQANLDVGMTITEVDPTDYSWTHGTDFQTPTQGTTVLPRPAPQGVADWAASGVIVTDASGLQKRPAIQLSWDGTLLGLIGIQYEVRLKSDSSSVGRGRSDQLAAGSLIITQGLLSLTVYQVRGQYIPSAPRDMLWSDWIDVTTPDARLSIYDFDDAVRAQVTSIFDAKIDEINAALQEIASIAANQDSRNWLDKKEIRTQLAATAGTALAEIDVVQSALVDAQTAFASFSTTVSATFGPAFSSVNTVSNAVATLDGYAASSYGVTLNTNGYASGFQLVNGGGGISSFTIVADKFQIQLPGINGNAPVPFFTTGLLGATPTIAIRGNFIADGTITATKISVGTLSAIVANLGTVTAGTLSDPANQHMLIDLNNSRITISDFT